MPEAWDRAIQKAKDDRDRSTLHVYPRNPDSQEYSEERLKTDSFSMKRKKGKGDMPRTDSPYDQYETRSENT